MTRPQSSRIYDRHALANQGMVASIATRSKAKCNQKSPICIYSVCEALGVKVRFNNINMEGMYQKGTPPRIHLSARRPLPRRGYNCAHELGHHVFGHGSSIDELREDLKASVKDPKEFLVDAFAGFLMMPTLGMRRVFAVRGWDLLPFFYACRARNTWVSRNTAIWRMISMSKSKKSPAPEPFVINDTNLSRAWSRIFLRTVAKGAGTEISPLVLSISGFDDDGKVEEVAAVRKALDGLLKKKSKSLIEDVAFTIFPQRLWDMARGNRKRLFDLYKKSFPRYQAMNRQLNGRGLYFERLMMYGRGPCDGNQLEWILSQYVRIGVRRSMLQGTTFDPGRDHVASAQLGFPCLQHVSFEPTEAGLVINAFYATQQIFDKAYGNYLGLIQLGGFMAHEMHTKLTRLNVMVGIAKLERITKSDTDLATLLAAAEACVNDVEVATVSAPGIVATAEAGV